MLGTSLRNWSLFRAKYKPTNRRTVFKLHACYFSINFEHFRRQTRIYYEFQCLCSALAFRPNPQLNFAVLSFQLNFAVLSFQLNFAVLSLVSMLIQTPPHRSESFAAERWMSLISLHYYCWSIEFERVYPKIALWPVLRLLLELWSLLGNLYRMYLAQNNLCSKLEKNWVRNKNEATVFALVLGMILYCK